MPPPSRFEKIKGKAASQLIALGKPAKDAAGSSGQPRPLKRPLPSGSTKSPGNETSPAAIVPKKQRIDPRLQRGINAGANTPPAKPTLTKPTPTKPTPTRATPPKPVLITPKPTPTPPSSSAAPLFTKGGSFSLVSGSEKDSSSKENSGEDGSGEPQRKAVTMEDLEGIGISDALRLIMVSGLSEECARKLLEIIEASIATVTDLGELKKVSSFVATYSTELGLEASNFWTQLKLLFVKKEGEVEEVPIVVSVRPFTENIAFEDVTMSEICELTSEEAVEAVMDEALAQKSCIGNGDAERLGGNQSQKWANFVVTVAEDPQVAQWALSALDKRLKDYLLKGQVDLLVLLMNLMNCAPKKPELMSSLVTFAEKIEKTAEVPAFILSTLRKLLAKPSKPQFGFRRSIPDAQGKAGFDLSVLDADATLRKLIDVGGTGQPRTVFRLNHFDVNRLINHYLILCPEVVDDPRLQTDNSTLITKVRQMFASSSEAINRLIVIIPHRAKKTTIEFLYDTVLTNVDERLNVSFVLDFVAASVDATNVEAKCFPSPKQTAVFVEYCIVQLMDIASNVPPGQKEEAIQRLMSVNAAVLETIISESKAADEVIQQLLEFFEARLSKLPQSAEDERRLEATKRFASKMASIFPVFSSNDPLDVAPAVESMAAHDQKLHQLILSMVLHYDKNEPVNGKKCLDRLMSAAKLQPSVFVRHIPMLTAKLYTISQISMGVKRMKDSGYYEVFLFVLRAISAADPESFAQEEDVRKVLEFYFEYFKSKIMKTKSSFIELVKVIADVCLLYMERCKPEAQDFLLKKITYLIEMKSYCHDYVALRLIIDSLPNCPEKQAMAQHHPRSRDHYQRDHRDTRRDFFKR